MLRFRGTAAIGLVVVLTAALSSSQQVTEIPSSSAAEHLVKKVDPVYPPLAKAARLQGTVTLKVVISKEGNVTDVKTAGWPT